MIAPSRIRNSLVIVLLALLSACGPKQSPQTQQYLQKITAAVDQLDNALAAISQEAAPKASEMPKFSEDITPAEEQAFEKYSMDMTAYYSAIEETGHRVSSICNRFQSDTFGLDKTDVDPAATDLADRYIRLSNRRLQLAVNFTAFVSAQQMALLGRRVLLYAPRLNAAAIAAMTSPTSAGGNFGDFQPTAEEKPAMDSGARSVQQAIAQLRSDSTEIPAARNELASTLKAQYPGSDWSFLAAK